MTKDLVDNKNHKNFKKQAGQILIIFLLILVVGLALVLSVASRSITDIRITTSTDESNRAYFAAEAGVEEALAQLQIDQNYSGGDLNFTAINQTTAKVNVSELDAPSGGAAFKFPEDFERDSVAQVNLLNKFNDLSMGSPVNNDTDHLIVYWGNDGLLLAERPAIEVSVVHINSAGAWGIKKFAFDPNAASHNNNFCSPTPGGSSGPVAIQGGGSETFAEHTIIEFMSGYPSPGCPSGPELEGVKEGGAGYKPVLARIRFLYNDAPQPIAVGTGSTFDLPTQGTEVISTGSTVSGVTRKLKVTNLFPSLPAIFDYVLFSGLDLRK